MVNVMNAMERTEKTIFAAGCFWGVQAYFDQVPGVIKTTVGYTGGRTSNPTYEQVCSHTTGHAEAVEIEFDPQRVSYAALLQHFFRMHDPTQLNRQGPDVGDNYRSALFYTTDNQRQQAEAMIKKLDDNKTFLRPIVTEVVRAGPFYVAEAYHQKYFEKTGEGACRVPYVPIE